MPFCGESTPILLHFSRTMFGHGFVYRRRIHSRELPGLPKIRYATDAGPDSMVVHEALATLTTPVGRKWNGSPSPE
jgi:hypothetical protein